MTQQKSQPENWKEAEVQFHPLAQTRIRGSANSKIRLKKTRLPCLRREQVFLITTRQQVRQFSRGIAQATVFPIHHSQITSGTLNHVGKTRIPPAETEHHR